MTAAELRDLLTYYCVSEGSTQDATEQLAATGLLEDAGNPHCTVWRISEKGKGVARVCIWAAASLHARAGEINESWEKMLGRMRL